MLRIIVKIILNEIWDTLFLYLFFLERLPVAVRQQVFDKLSCSQKINDMTLSLFLTDNSKGYVQ